MRLVTGEAGRFEPVGCVALCAGNFRVLAREFCQLIADRAVAVKADACQRGRSRNLSWCVRIAMTGTAILDLWSVRRFMAGRTLGHDRVPVPLARVIGVKDVMALLARETVPAAIILQVAKLADVALGALGRRELLRFGGILLGGRRYGNRCDFLSRSSCKRYSGEHNCDHHP